MPVKPKSGRGGHVLVHRDGSRSKAPSGKVRRYRSAGAAKRAARYINALDAGWRPTRKRRKR